MNGLFDQFLQIFHRVLVKMHSELVRMLENLTDFKFISYLLENACTSLTFTLCR
jgi:hypothetical protein